MSPAEHEMMLARSLAMRAHANQIDKAGRDYFLHHVADVAHRVGTDPRLRTVAYLHDVVEDTVWTLEHLAHAGFSGEVIAAVDALTRRMREHPDDYYARVKADPLALQVKFADIGSNTDSARLAALDERTRERLTRKYEHALAVLSA